MQRPVHSAEAAEAAEVEVEIPVGVVQVRTFYSTTHLYFFSFKTK